MFDIETNLFIGILGLKYPRSKDVNLSKKKINKYLGIPNKLINAFYFDACKSTNVKEKYHSSLINHINIVRHAYDNGYPYVLVFEDDIDFMEFDKELDIKHIFYTSLEEMVKIPNLDRLNYAESMLPAIKVSKYIYKTDYTPNAHMYILSRSGMEKTLNSYYPRKFKDDHLAVGSYGTFNQFDLRYGIYLNSYVCSPQISYQRKQPGVLKSMNVTTPHHIYQKNTDKIGKYIIYLIFIFLLLLSLIFPNIRLTCFKTVGIIFIIVIFIILVYYSLNYLKIY